MRRGQTGNGDDPQGWRRASKSIPGNVSNEMPDSKVEEPKPIVVAAVEVERIRKGVNHQPIAEKGNLTGNGPVAKPQVKNRKVGSDSETGYYIGTMTSSTYIQKVTQEIVAGTSKSSEVTSSSLEGTKENRILSNVTDNMTECLTAAKIYSDMLNLGLNKGTGLKTSDDNSNVTKFYQQYWTSEARRGAFPVLTEMRCSQSEMSDETGVVDISTSCSFHSSAPVHVDGEYSLTNFISSGYAHTITHLQFAKVGYNPHELVNILEQLPRLTGLTFMDTICKLNQILDVNDYPPMPKLAALSYLKVINNSALATTTVDQSPKEDVRKLYTFSATRWITLPFLNQLNYLSLDNQLSFHCSSDNDNPEMKYDKLNELEISDLCIQNFYYTPLVSASLERLYIINSYCAKFIDIGTPFAQIWNFAGNFADTLLQLYFNVDTSIMKRQVVVNQCEFKITFSKVKVLGIPFVHEISYQKLLKECILPCFPTLETLVFLENLEMRKNVEEKDKMRFVEVFKKQNYGLICNNLKKVHVYPNTIGSFIFNIT